MENNINVGIQPEDRLSLTVTSEDSLDVSLSNPEQLNVTLEPFAGQGGGGTTDYNALRNRPSINGVTLIGNKTSEELYILSENTMAGWRGNASYIPRRGEIVIYTDYASTNKKGRLVYIPNFKIGDGSAYLADLPFVDEDLRREIHDAVWLHEQNAVMHITQAEREFWNAKLNYNMVGEQLILNRN